MAVSIANKPPTPWDEPVSENGLKLETTQKISKGDTLLITVDMENDLVDLRGEVIDAELYDEQYVTGIEFQDISEEGRRIFKKSSEVFRFMQANQA